MAQLQKPRNRAYNRTELGDSWVVDSGDRGESSTDQSSDSSTLAVSSPKPPLRKVGHTKAPSGIQQDSSATYPAGHGSVEHKTSPASPRKPGRGRPKKSIAAGQEPELIMPSIHEETTRHFRSEVRKRKNPQTKSTTWTKWASPTQDTDTNTSQVIESFVKVAFRWAFDIIGGALGYAKTPLSYALAIYLLVGLMVITRNMLTSSIYSALSPICRIPGASLLHLGICQSPVPVNNKGNTVPVVEFDQLMETQSKFEEILEETAAGVTLPMDMKRSEASIRDLRQLVTYSNLRSKDELLYEFGTFITTSGTAANDLMNFGARVGSSVDKMLSMNKHTKRVLEGMAERDATQGAISLFFSNNFLAPFMPIKFTEDLLLDQFSKHSQGIQKEIDRLIDDGMALQLTLKYLEDQLENIYGISVRDNNEAQFSKDQVLSQLWTILGGNRTKLSKFESELKLLQKVNTYRMNAAGYVGGTLLKLQAIRSELEVMRETVSSGELETVPLSVHIDTIQQGMDRLQMGRDRANKLLAGNMLDRIGKRPQEKPKTTVLETTPINTRPYRD
ncbi:hypothetical protein MMC34_007683 [Xylographa carneopallida]|nr:hypothetical protein [Xylographa carneopallida]